MARKIDGFDLAFSISTAIVWVAFVFTHFFYEELQNITLIIFMGWSLFGVVVLIRSTIQLNRARRKFHKEYAEWLKQWKDLQKSVNDEK